MTSPPVPARMKESNRLSRPGINRSDVSALVPIAQYAGMRQVVSGGRTAVLPAYHVVNLVREPGVVFMDEAVFAAVIGAAGYFGAEFLADITGRGRGFGGPSPSPFSECAPTP